MRNTRRRLELRPDTLRQLTAEQLPLVRGGVQASGDACKSVNPCPGEYTWFCTP